MRDLIQYRWRFVAGVFYSQKFIRMAQLSCTEARPALPQSTRGERLCAM